MTSEMQFTDVGEEDEFEDQEEDCFFNKIEADIETDVSTATVEIVTFDETNDVESVSGNQFEGEEDDDVIVSMQWISSGSEAHQTAGAVTRVSNLGNMNMSLNNQRNHHEIEIDIFNSQATRMDGLVPELIEPQYSQIVWDIDTGIQNVPEYLTSAPISNDLSCPSLLMSLGNIGAEIQIIDDYNITEGYPEEDEEEDEALGSNPLLNFMNDVETSIEGFVMDMNENGVANQLVPGLPWTWLDNQISEWLTTSTDDGSHPLDQEQIDQLEAFTIKSDPDGNSIADKECSICMEQLIVNSVVVRLPQCDHVFHRECIMSWLSRRSNCPLCRCKVESGHHRAGEEPQDEVNTGNTDNDGDILADVSISE